MVKTAVVIPARYNATRLPGKPLLDRTGKPLIQHVLENAMGIQEAQEIVVATDDERIAEATRQAGGTAIMTSPDHASGTDRLAEAVASLEADLVINLQGDEPDIDTAAIDSLIREMVANPSWSMGTLATPIRNTKSYRDPATVKVVCDLQGFALYFSRAMIPWQRDALLNEEAPDFSAHAVYKHLGVYAYRLDVLQQFASWPQTALERAEGLEQLRALEHGIRIKVVITERDAIGIDTPEDYETFVAACKAGQQPRRKD